MRSRLFVAAALGGIIILLACGFVSDWDWDSERYKFSDEFAADLAGINTVSISTVNGSIKVETWGENRVEIDVKESIRADSKAEAREIAEEVRLVGEREGSVLSITLDFGRFKEDKKRHNKYASSLKVKLPSRLALELESVNGSLEVPRMKGDLALETTNGSIEADGTDGSADLETTNGHIEIGKVGGAVRAETTNGSIELMRIVGEITASTTNGSICAEIPGELAGDVSLSTTNGSIELVLGPNSNCEIKADTSIGRVRSNLPATRFQAEYNKRHTYLRGTLGSGGHKVRLDSSIGSITIREK